MAARSRFWWFAAIAVLAVLAVLAALSVTREADDPRQPYIEFGGGGFIFNYNVASATYGFVARVKRRVPPGTLLEAEFDDPAGGPPLVVRGVAGAYAQQFRFESPAVEGVVAGRDYRVELRLIDPDDGSLIAAYSRSFRSELDQDMLPPAPTTIAPGYQPNPESGVTPPASVGGGGAGDVPAR
ncbi:MAG: hypothetical protein OEN55_10125 [Alphaproteobacteria bacterium]|nr:hypothetical protein [Alphaproteobacteria bacterium]